MPFYSTHNQEALVMKSVVVENVIFSTPIEQGRVQQTTQFRQLLERLEDMAL